MSTEAAGPPKHPPPWFVHDSYAGRRSIETPVIILEPRQGTA
jgi:hypothetical protein